MNQLIWSRPARQDLYRIAFDEMLWDVEVLVERIEKAPLLLTEFPELGEMIGSTGRRKWRVKGTPFLLIYKSRKGTVEISRVVHAASDWQGVI